MAAPADDPRAPWRELPPRIRPEDWITEQDPDPVPGADAQPYDITVQRIIESS